MTSTKKGVRLVKVAKEINVGIDTIAAHLKKKGFDVEAKPTTKLTPEMYGILLKDFKDQIVLKEQAEQINFRTSPKREEGKSESESKDTPKENNVQPVNESTKPITVVEEPTTISPPTKELTLPETEKTVQEQKSSVPPKVEEKIETVPAKEEPVVVNEPTHQTETTPIDNKPKEDIPVVSSEPPIAKENETKVEEITTPVVEAKKEVEKPPVLEIETPELDAPKVVGKIDLTKPTKKEEPKSEAPKKEPAPQPVKTPPSSVKTTSPKDTGKKEEKPKEKKRKPQDKAPLKNENKPKVESPKPKGKEEKRPTPPPVVQAKSEPKDVERVKVPKLTGPKVVGKIELPSKQDKIAEKKKRRRKRIVKPSTNRSNNTNKSGDKKPGDKKPGDNNRRGAGAGAGGGRSQGPRGRSGDRRRNNRNDRRKGKKKEPELQVSEKEIQDKIKATMAKLGGGKGKTNRAKFKRQKRELAANRNVEETVDKSVLQVTEFISANELASIMDISVTQIITTCFNLGIIVSINQRLDAELIELVTEEFGFEVEFISVTEQDEEIIEEDDPEKLKDRAPIVTIMGHVDHGKTSLLDYIRSANVVAGEVGGITQHIGAYEVTTDSGKQITFLDTPGHEAFTAMRARGAKVTDVAVIVIAADDNIMPQTKEAISHAQAADVPMIFAINKIDKPDANPEKIKQELASMNLLVEDWGGTYQSQEISAKQGLNIDELLEKILLEAELLELKANPDRNAIGTVVEASLDKGRGYVTTVLVQTGSMEVGDVIVAGQYSGKVKALYNERGLEVKGAGPATPVLILGLNGAPQAGDKLRVMDSEQEARALAVKREQIMREQQQRANKHITLDEIGRRLALGNFKELNLIVKGDVDGSVEALSDSLLKLSTEEIQVRIIHRSVGAIKESDVLLASASDAIIIGFQVRPSPNARRKAEAESIDIRMYSIIYDAIEEIKSAMEGMLEPKFEERFVCNIEVKNVFKITRVGTIAGCFVSEGKVTKDTKVRLLRDGIVIYTGEISSLKRFKDDVKDVLPGQECGIGLKNYNDIKVGDMIEGYEEIEIKRKLR